MKNKELDTCEAIQKVFDTFQIEELINDYKCGFNCSIRNDNDSLCPSYCERLKLTEVLTSILEIITKHKKENNIKNRLWERILDLSKYDIIIKSELSAGNLFNFPREETLMRIVINFSKILKYTQEELIKLINVLEKKW
jgi:hypothetical protein